MGPRISNVDCRLKHLWPCHTLHQIWNLEVLEMLHRICSKCSSSSQSFPIIWLEKTLSGFLSDCVALVILSHCIWHFTQIFLLFFFSLSFDPFTRHSLRSVIDLYPSFHRLVTNAIYDRQIKLDRNSILPFLFRFILLLPLIILIFWSFLGKANLVWGVSLKQLLFGKS